MRNGRLDRTDVEQRVALSPAERPRGGARAGQARLIISALALLLAVAAGCGWYLSGSPLASEESFALGGVSNLRLRGFFAGETTPEGRGFRWTDGNGTIRLPAQGSAPHVVSVTLSAPRPTGATVPLTVTLNQRPLFAAEQGATLRRYSVLIAPAEVRRGENRLGLRSEVFAPGPTAGQADRRGRLGVAVFAADWRSLEPARWIIALQALAIAAATLALAALLRRAAIPLLPSVAALGLFIAIQLAMRHTDVRFIYRWHALLLTLGLGALAAAAAWAARPQPGDGPLPWRPWWREHWPALAGCVAVTALMQVPLLLRFTTQIPGHPGDAFEYLWKLQIFSDYLVGRQQSPTFLPELLYPEGLELAVSEMTPANTLLGLPLTWLFGPVVSFNALNLSSYALSAFFTYLLARRLGAGRLAAWAGALIFAFTLRRFFQMTAGHLPLMPTQYIPLALYGLEGLLTRRRNWDAFVAAVGLALATWASLYYGTTLAVFMAGYALLQTGLRNLVPLVRATWRQLALAAAVLLALVAPFAQPYLEIRAQGVAMTHSIVHLKVHASQAGEYLEPNPYHPLWGEWARQFQRQDGGEHFVILGYGALALMLAGLWVARRRRLAWTLLTLSLITFALTLGPYLYVPDGPQIPLPGLLVYEYVPVLNGIRIWNRVVIYIALAAAILAALALTALAGRRRAYLLGTGAAAILLLGELAAVPAGFTAAEPRPVDLWLSTQPGSGAVMEVPTGGVGAAALTGSSVFHSLAYRKPSNMWYGTFYPPLYTETVRQIASFPDPRAVDVFQRLGTEYVIVNEWAMGGLLPDWERRVAALPELRRVYREGGYSVYRLGP